MKSVLIFIILFFVSLLVNAQSPQYPITLKKVPFGTYKFLQNDRKYNINQIVPIMQSNPEAYIEILVAKKKKNWYWGLAITSFGLIGTFIFSGGDMAYIGWLGLGLNLATIPLLIKFGKHSKNAVNIYNDGLPTSSKNPQLNFGIVRDGLGLIFTF